MEPNFNDRMFLASEAVYARTERGEVTDVVAELNNALLEASTPDEPTPER